MIIDIILATGRSGVGGFWAKFLETQFTLLALLTRCSPNLQKLKGPHQSDVSKVFLSHKQTPKLMNIHEAVSTRKISPLPTN